MSWFSEISAPLINSTKGKWKGPIQLSPEALAALEQVKEALCRSLVLYTSNFAKTFFLQTDASALALGAWLAQMVSREDRPVAYDSRKLVGPETHYSTTEKECLASKWRVELFCYYLLE